MILLKFFLLSFVFRKSIILCYLHIFWFWKLLYCTYLHLIQVHTRTQTCIFDFCFFNIKILRKGKNFTLDAEKVLSSLYIFTIMQLQMMVSHWDHATTSKVQFRNISTIMCYRIIADCSNYNYISQMSWSILIVLNISKCSNLK